MSRGTFLGREELAATDRRIIHFRNGRCRDISYGFLTSIESGRTIDWKWCRRALYAILATAMFACVGLFLPAYIIQGANGLSTYSNSLVDQMVSAIIPPAYQGSGSSMQGSGGLMPDMQANFAMVDLSGPAGSISTSITSAFTVLTMLAAALSILLLLAFVLQIKRGLVLTTPLDKYVFYYSKRQENEVIELIKILRAEAGIKKRNS